ncbi:unnamed protein product [Toxocara canis]|uniref:tRNA-synt_1c domain-containing protein n=1 Tax=Toxocara canis TaxID=6265 RepID=A0A183VA71_TOXCA|nr:unnamed protein product [Toxocara canis]
MVLECAGFKFTRPEGDIDEHAKKYVDRLRDAVAIPSVSAEPEHRKDVQRMMEWTKKARFQCL